MALRRRKWARTPRPTWLVFCEGSTERKYLARWKAVCRSRVQLALELCGGGPLQMMAQARRRQRDQPGLFDAIWCVCDVDHFDTAALEPALKSSARQHIAFALSNPCFELWLLLHFEDCQQELSIAGAQRRLRQHLPNYRKASELSILEGGYCSALERARRLHRDGQATNPSTSVFLLTECLRQIG